MKQFKFEPQSLPYLVATYLSSLLLAYFLEEFVRLSALFDLKFFAERINADDPLVWDITYEICFLIAYVIFDIVFCIAYNSRRKKFIKDTKGLITKKDGLIYHLKNYWISDTIIISIQVIAYLILFLSKKSLCPIAIIYRFCSVPFGLIASVGFLIAIHLAYVVWAQYNWRVSHYMHE
jgi:hypothetical protein